MPPLLAYYGSPFLDLLLDLELPFLTLLRFSNLLRLLALLAPLLFGQHRPIGFVGMFNIVRVNTSIVIIISTGTATARGFAVGFLFATGFIVVCIADDHTSERQRQHCATLDLSAGRFTIEVIKLVQRCWHCAMCEFALLQVDFVAAVRHMLLCFS